MMKFLFVISLLAVFYTYAGYPLILFIMSLLSAKPVKKRDVYPPVSIIVYADKDEKNIEAKVSGLLGLDYPRDKMEIIVGCDGATDEVYRLLKKYVDENQIRYAVSFQPVGKPAMINKMAKDARGEIFVFIDTRQGFERGIIKELTRCFADDAVGAVSGELFEKKGAAVAKEEGLLRWYEQTIREMEGGLGLVLSARGAVYAVRKPLFRYFPAGITAEDPYTFINAIMLDKKVVLEPSARAYGSMPQAAAVPELEIFSYLSEVSDRTKKAKIAFQLVSRGIMRMATPYFLALALLSGIFLLFAKGPAPAYAQSSASEIQRTQEIIDKELDLREKIERRGKQFIKEITVEGVSLLGEEEIKQAVLPFTGHWLSKDDIKQLISMLKQAYEEKGYKDRLTKVTYQIKKKVLKIKVVERAR
ncbi:MAG TPA: hypothetical protein DCL35_03045 [Candidatus Omnitrophica bacterium]|nr:hypothetical protein [Candidatus Omnitrophota bacterium]